jgi:hypothetical protein
MTMKHAPQYFICSLNFKSHNFQTESHFKHVAPTYRGRTTLSFLVLQLCLTGTIEFCTPLKIHHSETEDGTRQHPLHRQGCQMLCSCQESPPYKRSYNAHPQPCPASVRDRFSSGRAHKYHLRWVDIRSNIFHEPPLP